MPTTVRYVLAKMKPGVSREDYERFEREVDYVFCEQVKTIVSYRTHRITEVGDRIAPVVGTMLVGFTNTGRAPSPGSVNRVFRSKFRSTVPCWFKLSEYVPLIVARKRLLIAGRFQFRFARQLRLGM